MSLTIDNKTLRNLEEQVLKNKEDIAKHYQVDRVLADWGIKVIGVVATINDIPEGNYQYGDSYGLSSTSPMQYVIWTRANPNVGEDTDYWLNVGALSLVGPRGPQGVQGVAGPVGQRGSKWYSGNGVPASGGGDYRDNDQYLNAANGDVYIYSSQHWILQGNIKGPQGVQGPVGPKGEVGGVGPVGPAGPKGDTGASFQVVGILASTDLLPTPTAANRSKAYIIDGDMYIVIGDTNLSWYNAGVVEGVEGPQGPVGPAGPAGADIQIVHITGIPSTATQGNLTQDQVNTLLAHPSNYIQFFNENFYPQDVEIGEGYIVYSHVGQIGNETKIKNINLTIATGGWVLTETKLVNETQLNTKQDTLVSGTNIKTINNQSILGSGNLTIEGGGGGGGNDTCELLINESLLSSEIEEFLFLDLIEICYACRSTEALTSYCVASPPGKSYKNISLPLNTLPSDFTNKFINAKYFKITIQTGEIVLPIVVLPLKFKGTNVNLETFDPTEYISFGFEKVRMQTMTSTDSTGTFLLSGLVEVYIDNNNLIIGVQANLGSATS